MELHHGGSNHFGHQDWYAAQRRGMNPREIANWLRANPNSPGRGRSSKVYADVMAAETQYNRSQEAVRQREAAAAQKKAEEEAARRAKEEANRRAQEEANRRVQEENNRRTQEEASKSKKKDTYKYDYVNDSSRRAPEKSPGGFSDKYSQEYIDQKRENFTSRRSGDEDNNNSKPNQDVDKYSLDLRGREAKERSTSWLRR